jgi:hypothetical protein
MKPRVPHMGAGTGALETDMPGQADAAAAALLDVARAPAGVGPRHGSRGGSGGVL